MKLRYALLFVLLTITLTACNLTLAEDVTPPPDYIPPTPMPTLGPLYPAQAPNVENGAAIYAEKCSPCHGQTGLGDGPQGIQLGVTVRAYGLPEIARPASPAQYYTSVTRGNIERFMPPFASLDDQQRWDVVAYVLTLHTTPEQIAKGKQLFEANCANCSTDFFKDQEKMSALSEVEIARLIREGNDVVPAFGANLSDDDLWAVAAYLRTLSFGSAVLAQPTTAPVSDTPVAAEGTPVGTEQATAGSEATPVVQAGLGTISGSIVNKTGAGLPSDLAISLHGFDHSTADPTAGPQEVFTQPGTVNADGTYTFQNIEMPENRIFLVEAAYSGITLQSEYGVVETGKTTVSIPTITLYELSQDASTLVIDELHMFVQTDGDAAYQVLALYNFRNAGEKLIAVDMADKQEIPFLKFLTGAQPLGYEAVQDSAPFISTDKGFAMAPNEKTYGILAFSSVAREKETSVTQEFVLPAASVRIFVPDGMELKGDNITADSTQSISDTVYQSYVASNIKAGDKLTFVLTGTPKVTDTAGTNTATTSKNNTLLIGAGGLGIALILAGAWLYWRDRQRLQEIDKEDAEEEDGEAEFESSEDVMDAIIALDDLHRAKKIADEAYQKRRAELKEILKGMM
jgi:mono/diheme cytochrome c family protein